MCKYDDIDEQRVGELVETVNEHAKLRAARLERLRGECRQSNAFRLPARMSCAKKDCTASAISAVTFPMFLHSGWGDRLLKFDCPVGWAEPFPDIFLCSGCSKKEGLL